MNRIAEARAAELFEATKNWGRWGEDDERGALNLLTPEHVAEAAALVRTGDVVSCGRELPVVPAPDNPLPAMHHMTQAGDALSRRGLQASSDFVGVSFHGMAVSHIDALCHVFVDSEMYNGFPASLVTSRGARRNSIEVAFGGIAGRGVLLDVPRVRGVEWIEPGETITPDDLDAACAAQRVASSRATCSSSPPAGTRAAPCMVRGTSARSGSRASTRSASRGCTRTTRRCSGPTVFPTCCYPTTTSGRCSCTSA